MRLSRLALVAAASLLVAACSTGASVGSPSAAPSASPAATRIEVTLSDSFAIAPASMMVPAGVPVTFVVTNAGAIAHEFYLGGEDAQAEHEEEMITAGGMRHDEPAGIGVDPGETKELVFTFEEPGETIAGCHEPGHYAAGMKAMVTVSG